MSEHRARGATGGRALPTRPPVSPSRTRPPGDAHDQDLWPSWTEVPLERLGLTLLDLSGRPLSPTLAKGGVA